jgi:hypothetical protein
MKKTFILILILSLTISTIPAQKERERVIIINSGISLPFSSFANKKMASYAGFAGPGMNIGIDFLANKERYLTFSASAGYSILDFDSEAYRSGYDRIYNQSGSVTVSATNYHFFKTVAGLALIIPLFDKLDFLFSAQIGAALSIHPEIIVDHSQYEIINSTQKDPALSATSNLNLKLNYIITEKYGVNLTYSLNYLYPGFGDISGAVHHFDLPVRFQNINLGFVIKL